MTTIQIPRTAAVPALSARYKYALGRLTDVEARPIAEDNVFLMVHRELCVLLATTGVPLQQFVDV
jgi:hypothetical protein